MILTDYQTGKAVLSVAGGAGYSTATALTGQEVIGNGFGWKYAETVSFTAALNQYFAVRLQQQALWPTNDGFSFDNREVDVLLRLTPSEWNSFAAFYLSVLNCNAYATEQYPVENDSFQSLAVGHSPGFGLVYQYAFGSDRGITAEIGWGRVQTIAQLGYFERITHNLVLDISIKGNWFHPERSFSLDNEYFSYTTFTPQIGLSLEL